MDTFRKYCTVHKSTSVAQPLQRHDPCRKCNMYRNLMDCWGLPCQDVIPMFVPLKESVRQLILQ
jgi:hypothetical protein